MSDLDIKALEANFSTWRSERAPELSVSDAFERYAIELILREADLSDEDVSSGLVGGGDDGGIDGLFFFVNRRLMTDETVTPDPAESARLWVIQAKYHNGFGELPVQKMQSFVDDLLSFHRPVSSFTYYNTRVKEFISMFREKYGEIIGQPHDLVIGFSYVTKSDQSPNQNVLARVEHLKNAVKSHISSANVEFDFWGAARLTQELRTSPNRTLVLPVLEHFMASDGSVVCLARLDEFANFLIDEGKNLRQYLLNPNVRDYQGDRNPVNRQIRASLGSSEVQEFWWLNNGVTILADKCSFAVNRMEIVAPELVNGLQTSYEVFHHFTTTKKTDERSILVRIILPPDEITRSRIIKATNSQSPVDPLSLHANEDIHFDIEDLLKLYSVFYDRRKGEYRRLRKPISRIVGMKELAQTVIACVLQQPNQARARPMSILNREEGYGSVFDVNASRDVFLFSILLDRQVFAYLSARDDLDKDVRNDIQFYMDTWLTSIITQDTAPTKAKIAESVSIVKSPLDTAMLHEACVAVLAAYYEHGGDDKAAKGVDMRKTVLAAIVERLDGI